MVQLDFPRLRDFRQHGFFVVVELDTAASLDAFGDAAVPTVSARIKTTKRLAIVYPTLISNPARVGMLRLKLFFVGRGLPNPNFAAIPIHPAAGDRPALVPSQPIPFDDAHVHTEFTVNHATISCLYLENPSSTALSKDDTIALFGHQYTDNQNLLALRQGFYDCRAARPSQDDEYNATQSVSDSSSSSDSESETGDDVDEPPRLPWTHSEPFFRMWMDLSVLDDLEMGEPRTIQDELAELRAIQEDAFQTAVEAFQAKRMRVDQWRSTVDSESSFSLDGRDVHRSLPSGADTPLPSEVYVEATSSSATPESQCEENPYSRRPRVSVGTAPPFNLSITTLGSSWTSFSFSRVEPGRGIEGQREDAAGGAHRPFIAILLARVAAALISFRVFPKRSKY